MQFGFAMPHLTEVKAITEPWEKDVTGADQLKFAKWADKLGYAMISVPEHVVIPRQHLPLTGPFHIAAYPSMAFFAGATENIRVNSCISIQPFINPLVAAKALSTMDWLSSGRVTVTMAVGWMKAEFDALGVPYHERGAISEEYTAAMIELWTSEDPQFAGKYVNFKDVVLEPKCFQKPHVKLWFGGDADAVLRRIGRYGTGWWPFLTKPEDIPARIDFIKSQPDYNGQLSEIFYGFSTSRIGEGHVIIDDPKARPGQTRQEIIDRLGWFKTLGVTMSAVPIPTVTAVQEYFDYSQWVAEEIMPAVR